MGFGLNQEVDAKDRKQFKGLFDKVPGGLSDEAIKREVTAEQERELGRGESKMEEREKETKKVIGNGEGEEEEEEEVMGFGDALERRSFLRASIARAYEIWAGIFRSVTASASRCDIL